ncbi:LPXTG cell wall anchor domain-containing protein [Streptomyces sp. PLK6-54]|uniref:LPXTG cell wall anchor domain-containing protein n=1 Tax=Actinacidiphila acidipaludis TaxID=2873382 RepID=A0ABS7QB06_9ACTN|nr:LPXTG cell wall anchor domain-containing protein [Streptomyces acidipaludis]
MNFSVSTARSARRSAAVIGAAVVLAAGSAAFAPAVQAVPADSHGGGEGSSTATVLRAGLDVSLLNRSVDVPVNVALNDVRAPGDARETALTVNVGHGVEHGHPVTLLRAAVATAKATADHHEAEGYANIVNAQVHLPGLPLLSLVKLDAITSKATCALGHHPTASSHLVGVSVLGRHIALDASGRTDLNVPGVGRVSLDLTNTVTTSSSAAATALRLRVHVNPLSLGVAEVSGDVTLAQATCRMPHSGGSSGGSDGGWTSGGSDDGGSDNGGADNGGTSGGHTSGGTTGSTTGGSTTGSATSGGSTTGSATSGGTSGSSGATGSTGSTTSGSTTSGGTSGSTRAQTVADTGNLAETGASSTTPYLVGGAAVLVALGAGGVVLAGRRRRAAARDGE